MQQDTFGEKLYTSTEVAQILGVSLRSIYRYLDDNKLQAAVRTATGRHRFTKQNINDFLHPGQNQDRDAKKHEEDDEDAPKMQKSEQRSDIEQQAMQEVTKSTKQPAKESASIDVPEEQVLDKQPKDKESDDDITEEVKEEPIDWLSRFRQAAEKYKTQDPLQTDVDEVADISSTENKAESKESPKIKEAEEPFYNYYRSGVGGLKEIAQSLDKSAKNASLDYAFTMNAGLSLHKPIKPFSIIHSYVRSGDLPYFEKVLQLTPCQKDTAQLCLIGSDDDRMYSKRKELHGLFVVSDAQIKTDLLNEGEVELANELD